MRDICSGIGAVLIVSAALLALGWCFSRASDYLRERSRLERQRRHEAMLERRRRQYPHDHRDER